MSVETTYSLNELLKEYGVTETEYLLRTHFHCARNSDIEKFLHHKAIRFEQADVARAYLIFDRDFRILAYFSLTFKVVDFLNISRSLNRKLTGGLSESDGVKVFLIGQIGKNDVENNPINLADILDVVFRKIAQAARLIGGRVVILECENHPKLLSLYVQQGFKQVETTESDKLKTMFIIPDFQ